MLSPILSLVRAILPQRIIHFLHLNPLDQAPLSAPNPEQNAITRGESLLILQETQNKVITGIYRVSVVGFAAFFLILSGFFIMMATDPYSPAWMLMAMAVAMGMLVFGFYRTRHEYRVYQRHFKEVTTKLREMIRQQQSARMGNLGQGKPPEGRILSAIQPQIHKGWDAKSCKQCERNIELSATTCPHCGTEQDPLLVN